MIVRGSLLDCSHTYIVHQANCVTTSSRGLARNVFAAYPYANTYQFRNNKNKNNKNVSTPGTIEVLGDPTKNQRYVVNLYAQYQPGLPKPSKDSKDSKSQRLTWFAQCLNRLLEHLQQHVAKHDAKDDASDHTPSSVSTSVAFPYGIGSGLAGGDWTSYLSLIRTFASACKKLEPPVQVEILKVPVRVLVCGDRNYADYSYVKTCLDQLITPAPVGADEDSFFEIIHGDCRGADRLAGRYAGEKNYSVVACPADWKTHGIRAGPIRNAYMLTLQPDRVIAFHNDLEHSKGTKGMIDMALKRGLPVDLCDGKRIQRLEAHLPKETCFPPSSSSSSSSFTLPFGKHQGTPLDQVPESYLDWLIQENDTDSSRFADVISPVRSELRRRHAHGTADIRTFFPL